MDTNNITWALDQNGYVVCLGQDGQMYRSQGRISDANPTTPLKFFPIGALPANITGRTGQLADVSGTKLGDRETVGASSR